MQCRMRENSIVRFLRDFNHLMMLSTFTWELVSILPLTRSLKNLISVLGDRAHHEANQFSFIYQWVTESKVLLQISRVEITLIE